jgi:hypothetical protein
MSKKIVRITESDLVKIVKRVINEQGGYDDQHVMASHSGKVLGGLNRIVDTIVSMLEQSISALTKDIPKTTMMEGINKMGELLEVIEDHLKKINPEIMLNRDLRRSVSDLRRAVRRGKDKLRTLSSYSSSFIDPELPGGLTGAGFSMGGRDLNDKLSEILLNISSSAEKLAFQVKDEIRNMYRRLDNLN